jgi:hypothetical protein
MILFAFHISSAGYVQTGGIYRVVQSVILLILDRENHNIVHNFMIFIEFDSVYLADIHNDIVAPNITAI